MENYRSSSTNRGAKLARTSFAFARLTPEGPKKEVYVISDDSYVVLQVVKEGVVECDNFDGHEITGDLETFITEKTENDAVLGVIPLTEQAYDTLKGMEFSLYAKGLPLGNWTPGLYKRESD